MAVVTFKSPYEMEFASVTTRWETERHKICEVIAAAEPGHMGMYYTVVSTFACV